VSLSLFPLMAPNTSFINVCNLLPLRLPMMHDQKSLMLHCHSFLWWGRERVSVCSDYNGIQFIKNRQWRTKVNILRLTVGYLNVTLNWKTLNTELEIGTEGSSHEAADWALGRNWNWTEPFSWSKPGPLVVYLDLLPTLIEPDIGTTTHSLYSSWFAIYWISQSDEPHRYNTFEY